jgi:exopolysaccharide biosynthesis polyprenyl glycosylphosphotransferase
LRGVRGGEHDPGNDRRARARLVADAVALAAAVAIAARSSGDPGGVVWLVCAAVLILAGFAAAGQYAAGARLGPFDELRSVVMTPAIVATCVAAVRLLVAGDAGAGDSAVQLWAASVGCVGAGRLAGRTVARRLSWAGPTRRPTLIVGAGQIGHKTAERLRGDRELGLEPVGFLDDGIPVVADERGRAIGEALPVLGRLADLEDVVRAWGIEQVVIAFTRPPDSVLVGVVRRCEALGLGVMVIPRFFEIGTPKADVHHVGGIPLISLPAPTVRSRARKTKYGIERMVAAFALVVLAPILGAIAAAIRLTMGGPVIFRQERVGEDGRTFQMLKFRSMCSSPEPLGDADAAWASLVLGDALPEGARSRRSTLVRCTRLGAMLRRAGLDELPQLVNVLRGEMSLIGPRPERVHYVRRFSTAIRRYDDRHRVRGGVTGWAQVNGLRGETSLDDRVEWDNFYIDNWTPWLDLEILCRTASAVVRHPGAGYGDAPATHPRPTLRRRRFVRATQIVPAAQIEDAEGRSEPAVAASR